MADARGDIEREPGWTDSGTALPPEFGPSLNGLAERYGLDTGAVRRLRLFGSLLVHDALAPTTVRAPALVRDDHLADSLVALELPEILAASRIADLGSGAGVPGIPLAIALSAARVTLVEGNRRKCDFIERAIELLSLENAACVNGRAETWKDGLGACELVTARAVAPLDVLAEYAAPLLTMGGALVVWRGRREAEAEAAGARAADILGLDVLEPVRVRPYEGAEHRYLHVMRKVGETPARFPRRDGVARKRPLGGA